MIFLFFHARCLGSIMSYIRWEEKKWRVGYNSFNLMGKKQKSEFCSTGWCSNHLLEIHPLKSSDCYYKKKIKLRLCPKHNTFLSYYPASLTLSKNPCRSSTKIPNTTLPASYSKTNKYSSFYLELLSQQWPKTPQHAPAQARGRPLMHNCIPFFIIESMILIFPHNNYLDGCQTWPQKELLLRLQNRILGLSNGINIGI